MLHFGELGVGDSSSNGFSARLGSFLQEMVSSWVEELFLHISVHVSFWDPSVEDGPLQGWLSVK